MMNSETSPENSSNVDPEDRKEQYFFRIVGLPAEKLREMAERLDGLPLESKMRKRTGDFVVSVELAGANVAEMVKEAWSLMSCEVECGVYAALLTRNESDGVRLPAYVCEFWRQVGGNLDFSFMITSEE